MILVAILALSGVVLTLLFTVLVGFPSMPANVVSTIQYVTDYMAQGLNFVTYFLYPVLLRRCVAVTLTFEGIIYGYRFVMWVVKKIPMFGVTD